MQKIDRVDFRRSKEIPTAVVTGGTGFLGNAIVRHLAMSGFRTIIHYQSSPDKAEKLKKRIEKIGPEPFLFQGDLEEVQTAPLLIDYAIEKTKRLDLLVNSASLFFPTPLDHTSPEEWSRIFKVNLFAIFFLCKFSFPWLKKNQGNIVNLTDIYGEHPTLKNHSAYCASKAALISITKNLALELGPDVRVNAVSPGAIHIPEHYSLQRKKELIRKNALHRQGKSHEIAEAVHFLARHPFITGQILNVDGGRFF